MPTVLRKDGFDFMIYMDDHEPPHVHVFREKGEVVVLIGDRQTDPSVRNNRGFSVKNERRALALVEENQEYLLEMWEVLHD